MKYDVRAALAKVMDPARQILIFNALILRGRWSGVEWAVWQRARELRSEYGRIRYLVAKGVDLGVPEEDCIRLPSFAGTRIGRIVCELLVFPFLLRGILRRLSPNAVREALFVSPAYVAPLLLPCRSMLCVYDLHVFTHPRLCSLVNVLHYRLRIPPSIRRADIIEVPSRHVADIVAARFPSAAARIVIRPLSLRPPFRSSPSVTPNPGVRGGTPHLRNFPAPPKKLSTLNSQLSTFPSSLSTFHSSLSTLHSPLSTLHSPLSTLHSPLSTLPSPLSTLPPYLLFVGHPGRRKNLPLALEAWRLLRESHGIDMGFVVVGAKDGWLAPEGVTSLGYVRDDDMPALYAGAAALVYPSVDEGFGLPLVEAAACSCPAIACYEVAKEVAPDAIVCAPKAEAIADSIAKVLAGAARDPRTSLDCEAPRSPCP